LHVAGDSIAPDMLWFNLNAAAKAARGRPWLQRDELRHAISAAVDRKAIINTVFRRRAEIGGPITSATRPVSPDLRRLQPMPRRPPSCWRRSICGIATRRAGGRCAGQDAKFTT
jgi:ABC-type transport system substrate-binding protein